MKMPAASGIEKVESSIVSQTTPRISIPSFLRTIMSYLIFARSCRAFRLRAAARSCGAPLPWEVASLRRGRPGLECLSCLGSRGDPHQVCPNGLCRGGFRIHSERSDPSEASDQFFQLGWRGDCHIAGIVKALGCREIW